MFNFICVGLVLLAVMILWWLPAFLWKKNEKVRKKVGIFLCWVNIPIYYSVIAPAFFEQPHLNGNMNFAIQIVGIVLILYASLLCIFMIIPKIKAGGPGYDPTVLLKNGAFAWVRHPQIAGIVAFSIGFACYKLAIYHLWLSVAYTILFYIHIKMEEKILLIPLFGDAYKEYQKTTKAWIPYLF